MLGLGEESRYETPKQKFEEHKNATLAAIGSFLVIIVLLSTTHLIGYLKILAQPINPSLCPIAPKLAPTSYHINNSTVLKVLHDPGFRKLSAEKLLGAVKIDTQVYDDAPQVNDDPKSWEKFAKFHQYLEKTFPTVYSDLKVDKINTYGLIFTWQGAKSHLEPLLLTAHQDTVPILNSSLENWTYPPLAGHYDGESLWGRGSSDNKNVLISLLESVELLLALNFKPARTVILGFGFDEEISGSRGAGNINRFLRDKYGKDSFYAIIDEGPGLMKSPFGDSLIAIPGTGEKGYLDIVTTLETPGGHSLNPPAWTSIGIVSDLAVRIERTPYDLTLGRNNPDLRLMQCAAVHSKTSLRLKTKALLRAGFDRLANRLVLNYLSKSKAIAHIFRTTQAPDIIQGGHKANALPEHVELLVNHRIAVEYSVGDVERDFTKKIAAVAHDHKVGLVAFGKEVMPRTERGYFKVVNKHSLEPAPVTPSHGHVWDTLAGSTRHVYEDLVFPNLSYPINTVPSVMTANTDTRHYWDLSRNIFRYSPAMLRKSLDHIHTIDESIIFDNHLRLIAFWYEYIQNVGVATYHKK